MATHLPIEILMDCSGSMQHSVNAYGGKTRARWANEGLDMFVRNLYFNETVVAELRIDSFDYEVHEMTDGKFVTLKELRSKGVPRIPDTPIENGGNATFIGNAIQHGINVAVEQKNLMKAEGIEYRQPIIIIFTDGISEYESEDDIIEATYEAEDAKVLQNITIIVIGCGLSEKATDTLRDIVSCNCHKDGNSDDPDLFLAQDTQGLIEQFPLLTRTMSDESSDLMGKLV